jgi:CDP-glucose 4,6-dehydratase
VGNSWKEARVVVTGATGFLGRHLCPALEHAGARVIGFSRHAAGHSEKHRQCDIEDPAALAAALRNARPDYVFHLAGDSIVGSERPLRTILESNVVGTMNVLDAVASAGLVRGVVVASTAGVYGESSPVPRREEDGLSPLEPYAVSKACADLIARSYCRSTALPAVVLRMANLYGPDDPHDSRLIPSAVNALLDDRDPVLRGDGRDVRDYLFVADAVSGLLAAAAAAERPDVAGAAFNLGTGRGTKALDVIEGLIRIAGRPNRRAVRGGQTGSSRAYLVDVTKVAEHIGWKATTTLEQGLQATWDWSVARRDSVS